MISDVMFDAIERVEYYRREFRCYDDDPECNELIDKALIAMRTLMRHLDAPPPTEEELAAIEAAPKPDPEAN
jgi:hypothetical protein